MVKVRYSIRRKMLINKKELIQKLEALKPGLSNKEIIEFADSFSFHNNQILTYNDFLCVKCPIDLDIEGTVKADYFHKIINKIKADKKGFINLKLKDNELIISTDKEKSGVPINLKGKLSLEELGAEITKWNKLPKDFQEGIRLSVFSASDDASNPKLTCLHINKKIIESSDGQRAFKYHLKKAIKKEFLLPKFSVPALLHHNLKSYNISKNWVHFRTKEDVIISCRMYEDINFPDTDFLFEIEGDNFTFPNEIKNNIEAAIIFIGSDEDENINVEIKKKITWVKSRSDNGWYRKKIIAKSKKEISFEINPFFLKDILKSSRDCIISDEGLMKFDRDNWSYVINISMEE